MGFSIYQVGPRVRSKGFVFRKSRGHSMRGNEKGPSDFSNGPRADSGQDFRAPPVLGPT